MKSDLVDVSVIVKHQTEKAILVISPFDDEKTIWIPKSQCELEMRDRLNGVLTLPEWLAIDKGLV